MVYGAQGPATIHLAEQCGIVHATNTTVNVRDLPEVGIANALDAGAGVLGGFIGGWLVDHTRRWHIVLSVYLVLQGLTFIAFTFASNFAALLIVSLAWGFGSTLTSICTQAAMTWVWAEKSPFWLQLNNLGFGIGALLAPVFVSLDLSSSGSFHRAYYLIGAINLLVAGLPLLLPTPQQDQRRAAAEVEGGKADSQLARNEAIVRSGTWRSRALWLVFLAWFGPYVASEIGLANWISPFATLLGARSSPIARAPRHLISSAPQTSPRRATRPSWARCSTRPSV